MQRLNGKKVLLGITGGIAAYKSAELVRILRRCGAEVRVVMTDAACEFITPLTLQALSGHPVHSSLLDTEAEAGMGHIELARWSDILIIAPATADFIARMSTARADNLLSAICLATRATVCIAPAMNQAMWNHPGTQSNIALLNARGIKIFGPDEGEQACGETGPGRMLPPETLAMSIADEFPALSLAGKRVLITAGPTRERIDPVRFLSNRSSGKMGFALAKAAANSGATVTLVAGPVSLPTPGGVHRIDVESARDMHRSVLDVISNEPQDIFISSAAVADYRPEKVLNRKWKKKPEDTNERASINLVRNPDILLAVSSMKKHRPFSIGFAAETDSVIENARKKMQTKDLDMMIVNDVSDHTIGFASDNNAVSVFRKNGKTVMLPFMSKTALAAKLMNLIAESSSRKGVIYDIKKSVEPEVIALNKS